MDEYGGEISGGIAYALVILFNIVLSIGSILVFALIKLVCFLCSKNYNMNIFINRFLYVISYIVYLVLVLVYFKLLVRDGFSPWSSYNPFFIFPVLIYTMYLFKRKIRLAVLTFFLIFPLLPITLDNLQQKEFVKECQAFVKENPFNSYRLPVGVTRNGKLDYRDMKKNFNILSTKHYYVLLDCPVFSATEKQQIIDKKLLIVCHDSKRIEKNNRDYYYDYHYIVGLPQYKYFFYRISHKMGHLFPKSAFECNVDYKKDLINTLE